jgi:hypothetical protein
MTAALAIDGLLSIVLAVLVIVVVIRLERNL